MTNKKDKDFEAFIDKVLTKVFSEANKGTDTNSLDMLINKLEELDTKLNDAKTENSKENNSKVILTAYKNDYGVGIDFDDKDKDILPNLLTVLLKAVHAEYEPSVLKEILSDFSESIKNS
jgi:hypothetical protein